MCGEERKKYVVDWKAEHEAFLNVALGYEDGPRYHFLACILFAPSSSKKIVPLLQDVIQADGAHTSFGKYSSSHIMDWPELESCYTGWPLPMASPISWKPLLQDRYLDEICTSDVKPRRWHTFLSVTVCGQQERTPKEERAHSAKICQKLNHNTQDCWKNPTNQSNATQGSADVGDGGEGEIGMAWTMWWCWGGGEVSPIACVWCTTYFTCDIWIGREVMCDIWRDSLIMCVFLK